MKRVCLKDVAEAAGVSAVTASIVLNGGSTRSRARVGAARQEEIRRIAAELGYRASAAARILKCKELNDIGLLFFENAQNIREHVGFTDLNIQFTRTCRELGIRCQVDWVRLPAPPGRAAGAADRRAGRRAADRRESERGVGTLPARAVPHALRADRGAGGILGHVRPCSGAA